MAKYQLINGLKSFVKDYFDLSKDLDDEKMAVQSVMDGVSFKGANIIILIIAIFIASLGLNTNSAAVIIGAMLISPLMGPIIGMGFGLGTYNFDLIKRSARNIAMAAGFSVLASTLYFLISPVSEGRSELLARTSPTIYDVFIGFFGGGAGIVALACKQKGNVLPGVAIATALMPPLCTAGYGLATGQIHFFFGAIYLFLINSIFIAFATTIGVKFFKFKVDTFVDEATKKRVKKYVYIILAVTILPSIWLTIQMLRESYFVNDANKFITEEMVFSNTQVLNKKAWMSGGKKHITVTLIGEQLDRDSLQVAFTKKLDENPWLRGATLDIHQGFGINSHASNGALNSKELTATMFNDIYADNQRKIAQQHVEIDSLHALLTDAAEYARLSQAIAPEMKVLFPSVTDISVSRNVLCNTITGKKDTIVLALVNGNVSYAQQRKLMEYLEVRTKMSNIKLVNARNVISSSR